MYITLVVANIIAFFTTIHAAPLQLRTKSLAEVQSDRSDIEMLFSKFFKDILPVIIKSIENGEPLPGKEIMPPFLSTLRNFLNVMTRGHDPNDESEGAAFMKAFEEVFSKLFSRDIRTRKEVVDHLLKLFNEFLSVASRKLNPNDIFLPIIGGFRRILYKSINGEGGESQVEHAHIPSIQLQHDFNKKARSSDHAKNTVQKVENEQESEVEVGAQPSARNPHIDNNASKMAGSLHSSPRRAKNSQLLF